MPTMDDNPLFGLDPSDSETTSLASYTSSVDGDADAPAATTPPIAVLQTVNIKSHVPVILELAAANYDEWRCFFDAFLGKFGLTSHVSAPPTADHRHDPEWRLRDQCILSWLYISIAKDVRDIVRAPKATAYRVWTAIHEQFRDNELHRAVYLEAEFRNLVQGDMTITQYTGRLKQLADALRDVGQPVRQTSQVLNMLRGLSSKYRHAIPAITSKQPPHTFLSARSYLLLEEQYDKEHAKSAAQHALLTTGGPRPTVPTSTDAGSSSNSSSTPTSGSPLAPTATKSSGGSHGAPNRQDKRRGRGRGRGRGHQSGGFSSPRPPMGWTPGSNPWTGMVQA
jgi:hypothetical protein